MSETEIIIDRIKYRPLREAAASAGISSGYLSKFCREGQVRATRIDGVWFVNETSLRDLLEDIDSRKREWHERLSAQRVAERSAPEPARHHDSAFVPLPRSRVAPRTLHRVVAERRAREASSRRSVAVASIASLLFLSSLGFALTSSGPIALAPRASTASIADVGSSIISRFTSFFDSIFAVNDYQIPPAWEKTVVDTPASVRGGDTINNTTNNNYVTNNNYIQTGTASGGISERLMDSKLNALENYLTGRIELAEYRGDRQAESLADTFSDGIGGGGFEDIDITDSTFTGGSISGASLSGVSFSGETAFPAILTTDATTTNLYIEGSFGFGTSSGLLRTSNGTASTLANGSNGQVLKMVGGNLAWSTDLTGGGGGGASFFASTTDNLAIYPADPTDVVIIGESATTTVGNILEVAGNALVRGGLSTYGNLTSSRFVATSSTASVFPYASTTALSTNSLCIAGDCRQAWPTFTDTSFSTSSADYWKTANNFFSTTSADYWQTTKSFFSTTSASYFLSQNQGAAFSTTSAQYFLSTQGSLGFSTTSNDYWLTQRNFFSTTSADYHIASFDKGFFFSTTSANAWKAANDFFSTTSSDYWQSQRNFFSTTSAAYFVSQNQAASFSTTSATYFAHSSTTIPKTYTVNTFTALQNFANASSTLFSASYASTTNLFANTASTSNLTISALQNGLLKVGSSGTVSLAVLGTDYHNFAYPFPSNATSTTLTFNGGLLSTASSTFTSNTFFPGGVWDSSGNVGIGTTSLISKLEVAGTVNVDSNTNLNRVMIRTPETVDNTAILAFGTSGTGGYASTNIFSEMRGIITQANPSALQGALTFRTNAGDSLQERMRIDSSGNVGIGTSTPYSKLAVWGGTSGTIFEAVTSASTTALSISATGNATTTLRGLNINGQATSTSNVGFNLTGGCYAVNGTCVGGGSASLSGTQGQVAYFSGTNTAVGTSTLFIGTNGNIGIGTTSPLTYPLNIGNGGLMINRDSNDPYILFQRAGVAAGQLRATATSTISITNASGGTPLFSVLTDTGNVGIGTTTPSAKLTVYGDTLFNGTDRYTNFGTTSGSSGYGFRDNGGVIEFKNANGTWQGVTTATTGPSFSVNKGSTNQTVVAGADTLLTWSTEVFDTNNNFANNRFTPTVPGKYLFSAAAYCASANTNCWVYLYKNGSLVSSGLAKAASGSAQGQISQIIDMNGSTDYVEVYAQNSDSTSISGSITLTYFTGAMIAPVNGNNAAGWTNDGSASFLLDNADLVGIGTTTPWAKLSISSTAGIPQLVIGSSTTQFIVDKNGNVGIGTSTPQWLLNPTSASAAQLSLSAGPGIAQWAFRNAGGNLYFSTTTVAGTATTTLPGFMISGSTGRVGIGTSSPSYMLEVDGDINVGANHCYRVNGICIGYTVKLSAIRTGTSTTNWSKPANLSYAIVELWGGGGAGGDGSNSSFESPGGGGGGGYMLKNFTASALAATTSVRITVGAGGTVNADATGGNGGTTNFGGMASSTGGEGGTYVSGASGIGGAGGTGQGGDINLTGQAGSSMAATDDGNNMGGSGGSAPRGGGGGAGGAVSIGSATAGADYGGGGGAATGNSSGTGVAAPGGPGGYVIYEYATSSANAAGNDYAEMFPVSNPGIAAGDIVAVDTGMPISMKLARSGEKTLAGVIATNPGQVLGDINAAGERPVALAGRVPVKVNSEGGSFKLGDRVAPSSIPGIGKKAGPFDDSVGIVIGPIEKDANGNDTVMVFLDLHRGIDINAIALQLLGQDVFANVASTSASSTASTTLSATPLDFVGGMMNAIATRLEHLASKEISSASTSTSATTTAATATSSAPADAFAERLMSSIVTRVGMWLADAGNGITEIFTKTLRAENVYADTVTANEICVKKSNGTHVCVTGDELESMMNATNVAPPPPTPEEPQGPTPESEAEADPEPESPPSEGAPETEPETPPSSELEQPEEEPTAPAEEPEAPTETTPEA